MSQPTLMYINAIQGADENEFSVKIKRDYRDLFTGIGNMNITLEIKLKDNVVPYVALIRRNHYIWNYKSWWMKAS